MTSFWVDSDKFVKKKGLEIKKKKGGGGRANLGDWDKNPLKRGKPFKKGDIWQLCYSHSRTKTNLYSMFS